MEFSSTSAGGYVHFGGDVVSGVNSTAGVMLSSNSVMPASDSSNANLNLRGKGTGGVTFGASTSAFTGMGRGIAASPLLALPASGLEYSTITIPGVAVGDVLLMSRSTAMSTALVMAGSWVTAADEGTYAVHNKVASTNSIAAGATFPYVFFKA
jgi:hypothetical protein